MKLKVILFGMKLKVILDESFFYPISTFNKWCQIKP